MPNTWNNSGERLVHDTDTQGIGSAPQNATQAYGTQSRRTGEDSESAAMPRFFSSMRDIPVAEDDLVDALRLSMREINRTVDALHQRAACMSVPDRPVEFYNLNPAWFNQETAGGTIEAADPIHPYAGDNYTYASAPPKPQSETRQFDLAVQVLQNVLRDFRYLVSVAPLDSRIAQIRLVESIALRIAGDLHEFWPDKVDPAIFLEQVGY